MTYLKPEEVPEISYFLQPLSSDAAITAARIIIITLFITAAVIYIRVAKH